MRKTLIDHPKPAFKAGVSTQKPAGCRLVVAAPAVTVFECGMPSTTGLIVSKSTQLPPHLFPRCIFIQEEICKMPKVFEWNGYKFFFFSNEGIPREPCHIHVRKGEQIAKFWVSPYISLASAYEMSAKELLLLEKAVQQNADSIRRKWDEHFSN